MKKLFPLLLLLTLAINSYSQESVFDMFKNKKEKKIVTKKEMSILSEAGLNLKKSANYQYAAIGFATASVGCFMGSAFMKDKYEYVQNKFDYTKGEIKRVNNSTKNGLLIGGGVCAFIGIICELNSIHYKFKSGKLLQLQGEKNGAGLAFVF